MEIELINNKTAVIAWNHRRIWKREFVPTGTATDDGKALYTKELVRTLNGGTTRCSLQVRATDAPHRILATIEQEVKCSYEDNYCKANGRRESLVEVFKSGVLDKKDRTLVWNAVLNGKFQPPEPEDKTTKNN